MDDIYQKEYAEFLEATLRELVTLPVEGICILAKLMIETLEKNRMIRGHEGGE